jgi:hypothetical protein
LAFHVVQQENRALRGHTLLDNTARGKDEGFIEELLGEFPMMGGRPAADVALTEKRGTSTQGSAITCSLPARSNGTGT